ncbi:MAG: hypothetical protein QOC81_4602 [Thermoanaerobaculia bacterium]|jgi:hypothetical protein|nr:hypothetical protein [Thermoanaerobaculia bacterium]
MNILHAITLAALLHHSPTAAPVCHKGTVSYKFVGSPGATFTYAGERFAIPANGSIELLTSETVYLAANGRSLPLDVWPIDAFGTRTVPVQTAQPDASAQRIAPVNPLNVVTPTSVPTIN